MAPIRTFRILLFRVPIEKPVRTSFGVMRDRPAVLIRLEDSDGTHGWGEVWCNFPTCGAEHRVKLLESAAAPLVVGKMFAKPGDAWDELSGKTHVLALQSGEPGPLAQVLAGVDIALWDLAARKAGQPLFHFLSPTGSGIPEVLPLPAYASGINPDVVEAEISRARAEGFRAFKFKVGFDDDHDLRNLERALEGLQPGERLAIDANQIWSPDRASKMVRGIKDRLGEGHRLEWLEEPLAADQPWSRWRELAVAGAPPLAGGENLRGAAAFTEAIQNSVVEVVQPDLCKWGGFTGCLPVARAALRAGKRYCPHYLGGGIGLLASAHLLAAAGGDGLLEVDINENPLREDLARPFPSLSEGKFLLSSAPGLGVEPDLDAEGLEPVFDHVLTA